MALLAAGKNLSGNLLDREVVVIAPAPEGSAEDQERPLRPYFIGDFLQLLMGEAGGGHIDKVLLGGMAMLPVNGVGRRIGGALQLTEGLGQHGPVIGLVDCPVATFVLFEEIWAPAVVTEAPAARKK